MIKKIIALVAMLTTALAMAAVDVNKASEAELDGVKGIGPGTSKLILTERKKGEFKYWQDLISRVKGVGDSRAAKLSAEGLTVGGATYKAVAASKKDDKKDAKASAKEDKKDAAVAAKPAAPASAKTASPAASAAKK
jgi:competence protein ComEA